MSCTSQKSMQSIKYLFEKAPSIGVLNKDFFDDNRKLILESLNDSLSRSDTLIFMETRTDGLLGYDCYIYCSNSRTIKEYQVESEWNGWMLESKGLNIIELDSSDRSTRRMIEYLTLNNIPLMKKLGDPGKYMTPITDAIIIIMTKKDGGYYADYIVTYYNADLFSD